MAEHDTERVDAEKGVKRSKMNLPLGDRKKAVTEPDANQPGQGTQTAGAEAILGLQQTHGNAYVQRLLKSKAVQAKLTVNPPDDQYEREADAVAATFAQSPASQVQRQAAPEEEEEKVQTKLQRQAGEEEEEKVQTKLQRQADEEEEEKVQTKAAGATPEVTEALEERINAARGSGQALPDSLRSSIEPKLGSDFSQVRLHTDAEADGLSRQLGAKAFTTGQDVFFREGDYQPDTEEGRGLIGHELTHVVQQGAAPAVFRQAAGGKEEGDSKKKEDTVAQMNTTADQVAAGQRHLMVLLLRLAAGAQLLGLDAAAETAIAKATELAVSALKIKTEGLDVASAKQGVVVDLLNAAANVMALGGDEKAVDKAISRATSWGRGQLEAAEKEMAQAPSRETQTKVLKNADLVYMLGGMSTDEFTDRVQRALALFQEEKSPKAAAAGG
jgi:hypothetical protein